MDNLLCDEVMSPIDQDDGFNPKRLRANSFNLPIQEEGECLLPVEDCEEALSIFLDNESSFMPKPGYLKLLQTHDFIHTARFKAVTFFIKFQRRMDVSVEIVFMAVNYLDRFISLDQCRGWKSGMFELLSVECLSVASKFVGTATNFVNEFQMNGDLENSFGPTQIQEMELTLMRALGWRMNSTTPFSYIHLMIQKIESQVKVEDLRQRVTELLVNALLDSNFVEFQQCVVATCAIRCIVEEDLGKMNNASVAHLLPQQHKDECLVMMEQALGRGCWGAGPSSPVTVLKDDNDDDEELFCVETISSSRKRKMEERNCI